MTDQSALDRSFEIYKAFITYVNDLDDSRINSFTRRELEDTLEHHYRDERHPAFKAIQRRLSRMKEREKERVAQTMERNSRTRAHHQQSDEDTNPDAIWHQIQEDYGVTKKAFGKKIAFVREPFRRKILFRDAAHAYCLANKGFSKPALILAGGVIEELLRLYLKHKKIKSPDNTFHSYITTCAKNDLIISVTKLTDSFRDFRNLVHLAEEKTVKMTISKATAKGAVSSIFTVANAF